jgi:hypothetical protein
LIETCGVTVNRPALVGRDNEDIILPQSDVLARWVNFIMLTVLCIKHLPGLFSSCFEIVIRIDAQSAHTLVSIVELSNLAPYQLAIVCNLRCLTVVEWRAISGEKTKVIVVGDMRAVAAIRAVLPEPVGAI